MRFGRSFIAQAAMLIALVLGSIAAVLMSFTDFSGVSDVAWIGLPKPFLFGAPTFPIAGIISMCIVMLVIYTEGHRIPARRLRNHRQDADVRRSVSRLGG
jgi:xanthine/uracil permease